MTDVSTIVAALIGANQLSGFPELQANIFKSIGSLVGAALDVPQAWLEGKSQSYRDDKNGRSIVAQSVAQAVAQQAKGNPELGTRAVDHFAGRLLRQQSNREFVMAAALEDLQADPPTAEASASISEDWLDVFSRFAETRSDDEIRLYFAKLLAKEIRKPGSFSPATIEALSRISPKEAELFQALCALLTAFVPFPQIDPFVITQPFGSPGDNRLQDFGLNYAALSILQSAGFLTYDLSPWRELPLQIYMLPMQVAKTDVNLVDTIISVPPELAQRLSQPIRVTTLNLTPVGTELQRIVHAEPNAKYIEGLRKWLYQTLGVERTSPQA